MIICLHECFLFAESLSFVSCIFALHQCSVTRLEVNISYISKCVNIPYWHYHHACILHQAAGPGWRWSLTSNVLATVMLNAPISSI